MNAQMIRNTATRSWPQLVERAGERDRFADVRDAANPGDRPLHTQAEPGVDERAVLAEIEVPAVSLQRQSLLLDAADQPVVVVLALAAADDLAIAFRRQHVVVQDGPR